MKKLIYFAVVMITIVVMLPLTIVKGCGPSYAPKPHEKEIAVPELEQKKITVYNPSLERIDEMVLDEYIKGVLAAEMPADFSLEALKAQAVAARTFAYGRMTGVYKAKQDTHEGADICTNSAHCQAWMSKEAAKKKWSALFAARNWAKIERAVKETSEMIVVYQGSIANTLFHASSCGKTENAEEVWSGVSVPYLRSVESDGEEASRGYITTISLEIEQMIEKLSETFPENSFSEDMLEGIKIMDYTTGGRVKTILVGDVAMKGTQFRTLFGLRSSCFTLRLEDEKLEITTTGHGHGVGMSQWGADSLAKKGGTYIEILKHYYTGVDIVSIQHYENVK